MNSSDATVSDLNFTYFDRLYSTSIWVFANIFLFITSYQIVSDSWNFFLEVCYSVFNSSFPGIWLTSSSMPLLAAMYLACFLTFKLFKDVLWPTMRLFLDPMLYIVDTMMKFLYIVLTMSAPHVSIGINCVYLMLLSGVLFLLRKLSSQGT